MRHSDRRTAGSACYLTVLIGSLALLAALSAKAQDDDPPTRVARLAYLQGAVSFEPAGTPDWVAPSLNRPLTTGDQLWVDQDGRAELQLDGSVLGIGASTAISFLNLADHVTQVQLSSGTLIVYVHRLDDGETYEIDTPNLAFTVQRPGIYRLSVDAQGGTTAVAVRRGLGEATGGGTAYDLNEGEYDTFSGTDQLVEIAQSYGYSPDDFDAWGDAREARWARSMSARYVSPDVVGYEDLDDHQGTWTSTPQYGAVWIPAGVERGWAPYTVGHWAYVPPWGYTWVDDQPWGFAPFHYGRWVWTGAAWGWIPPRPPVRGVAYVQPVYAPALVAWVGVGADVAWFALGPREVYVPSYPVSRAYVNNINVSNTTVSTTTVTNIYNTTIVNKTVNVTTINYVNRSAPGAVVATSTRAFTLGAPVARNRVAVNASALAAAPVRALTPSIVPTLQAVLGPGRIAAKPPAAALARPVVARTAPPPPPPTFAQRQKAIESNGGRPLSVVEVRRLQAATTARAAAVRMAPPPKTVITPKPAPVRGTASPTARGAAPATSPQPGPSNETRAAAERQRQQGAQQAAEKLRAQQAAQQAAETQRVEQSAQQAAKKQRAQQAAQQQAAEAAQRQRAQQAAEKQRAQQAAQQAAEKQRAQQAAQQAAEKQRAQQAAQQAVEKQRAQQAVQQQAAEAAQRQRAQQAAEKQRVQQAAAERQRAAQQQADAKKGE